MGALRSRQPANASGEVPPEPQLALRWDMNATAVSDIQSYMKTMIDIDDKALASAARELGTLTKKDTVNAALVFIAGRRQRIDRLLHDTESFGVGEDIADPEIMRQARR